MRHKFIRSLVAAGVLAGAASAVAVGSTAGAVTTVKLKGTTWEFTFNWTGIGTYSSSWTFNKNHTVTTPGWSGPITWSSSKKKVTVTYETAVVDTFTYDCHAVYSGKIKKGTKMKGTMSTDGNSTCYLSGVWSAVESSAAPNATNHTAVNASGQR